MTDQVEPIDMKTVDEGDRGAGHRVKAIGETRFGRLAEADLIRGHDPIARLDQRLDGRLPIARREISPVQQDDRSPRRRTNGRYVHVSEAQILALESERQEMDRIRVGESLERDSQRLAA